MNRETRRLLAMIAGLVGILFTGLPLLAQTASPTSRLPRQANAVMTIDVAKLLQSPLGKKLELQSKLASGYADRPLAVPATAKRVAIAALIHPGRMDSIWQAAVIEMSGKPRLEPLLRAQGGYLDLIEGKQAAWTSRDVFYIVLDDHTLGVVSPGQRQFVTRWASGKLEKGLSPFLSSALTAAGDADIVFAVDMDDVVGQTAIRYALGMGQLESLEAITSGQDKLLAALASLKGMRIVMRVSDSIAGEWIIDFDQDVTALGNQAKQFVIDVLTAADSYEQGLDQWEFKAEGKRIVGKGPVLPDAVNRLIALLSPANIGDAATANADASPGATGATPAPVPAAASVDPKAAASQAYYRAISKMLDSIGPKPSPKQGATWLLAQAKMIQQLPIVNVDPALIDWGNTIAEAFVRAAQELGLGQQKAMIASQSIASPTAYASYTDNSEGSGSDSPETRAAYRNAQQQRRQVSQTERAAAAQRAFDIINQMLGTRGKIRVEMTQKYGVEF